MCIFSGNFRVPPAALPGAKLLKKFDQNFL
jgi:hypothetical protein